MDSVPQVLDTGIARKLHCQMHFGRIWQPRAGKRASIRRPAIRTEGRYPWMSNCSGGSAGSLFTIMVLPLISSSSFSHFALLALRILTTSG